MKGLFLLCAFVSMFATCNFVSAQKELGISNSVSVRVDVGSAGVDMKVATPTTPYLALRGGLTFMPNFSISTDVDVDVNDPRAGVYNDTYSMDVKGSLKRAFGQLLMNVYPFPHASSFFVTVGAYLGGSSLVKIEGYSDKLKDLIAQGENASIAIGDYTIPMDSNGNASGGLKVSGFCPYLGPGFGRVVPRKRVGVMFELSMQLHSRPGVYTDSEDVKDLLSKMDGDNTFTRIMDKLTIYPVMKIRIYGRMF